MHDVHLIGNRAKCCLLKLTSRSILLSSILLDRIKKTAAMFDEHARGFRGEVFRMGHHTSVAADRITNIFSNVFPSERSFCCSILFLEDSIH